MVDPVENCGAVGQGGEVIVVADQKLSRMQPQAVARDCSSPTEVTEDRIDASIYASDRVLTRHVPLDVVREQGPNRFHVPARVHCVLRLMKPVKQQLSGRTIHTEIVAE